MDSHTCVFDLTHRVGLICWLWWRKPDGDIASEKVGAFNSGVHLIVVCI
jgi:hypothetical protein